MRKLVIGILIVCLYCFPYVYFSMYQDFANGSMLGYILMITVTSLLAFCGKWYSNSIPVVMGNIVSAIVSFYLIGEIAGNERWDGYFKPLSANQLLILVTILNLIPQYLIMKLANRHKKQG